MKIFLKPCPVCYGHTAAMFTEEGAKVVRCVNCGCACAAQATEDTRVRMKGCFIVFGG